MEGFVHTHVLASDRIENLEALVSSKHSILLRRRARGFRLSDQGPQLELLKRIRTREGVRSKQSVP